MRIKIVITHNFEHVLFMAGNLKVGRNQTTFEGAIRTKREKNKCNCLKSHKVGYTIRFKRTILNLIFA